jgi:hypothetical protein
LLIVVIIYLLSINKNIQNNKKKQSNTKNMADLHWINTASKNIEQMDADSLLKAVKVIFDSFKL